MTKIDIDLEQIIKEIDELFKEQNEQHLKEQNKDMPTPTQALTTKKAKVELDNTIVEIKRSQETKQIIMPQSMPLAEGIKHLTNQMNYEEKNVEVFEKIPCFPLDGLLAVAKAFKNVYGHTELIDKQSFFGPQPPLIINVPMSDGSYAHAPLGLIQPPAFEGGFLETRVTGEPCIFIVGTIKRKFQADVDRVLALTKEYLRDESMYKGTAIMVDLSYLVPDANTGKKKPFDVLNDAPQFMNVKDIKDSDVILSAVTRFEVETNILLPITQAEACTNNEIPLKHGCLLLGPYGTGKTMLAKLIGKYGTTHGWTFIYVKKADQTAEALKLAEMYAPAIVFSEDIDQVTSGTRDSTMNTLLNTIDGIDTKKKPIITILTTNNPEKIHPGFMRAGRIDTTILMDAPDQETVVRFIYKYALTKDGVSLLEENINLAETSKLLAGFVPAFIAEAVQKAKKAAIFRDGPAIVGKVTATDLENAAKSLIKHVEMTKGKTEPTEQEKVASAVVEVHRYAENNY